MSFWEGVHWGMGFSGEMGRLEFKCPFCFKPVNPEDRVCPNCKKDLPVCPHCKIVLPYFDECPSCGENL